MSRLTDLMGRVRRRHADPYTAEQDSALRQALVTAAESVSPADDGLDQIRRKIASSQSAAHRLHWNFGVRAAGEPWWRSLLPPRGWLPAVTAAVIERFRPDPNRAGWFGWLRPAAAVGTGLFVVTAASLAVAGLPAVLKPNNTTGGPVVPPSATKTHHPKTETDSTGLTPSNSGSGSSSTPGQNGGTSSQPQATPSCTPTGVPSATPTGTPSTITPTTTPTTPTITPTDTSSSPADGGSSSTSSPTAGSAPTTAPGTGPQPSTGAAPTPGAAALAPLPAVSPKATGKALFSPAARGQYREEVVRATLVDGRTASPSPNPADTPLPTASPTVGGPVPTQTPVPTVPPAPCS